MKTVRYRGVVRGGPGVPGPGKPSFEQTTYNIQVAKTPWQYLGHKSHCWKAHFFKICFVKYFRQRVLSLVNMGLHAAIIRLSPMIHEGEQRYKPKLVGDPRTVSLLNITKSLCDPHFEKSWLRPCVITRTSLYRGALYGGLTVLKQAWKRVRIERNSNFCDTGAVLFSLSYQSWNNCDDLSSVKSFCPFSYI